jgi:hypothetical protein
VVRGFRPAAETCDENELTGAPCAMRYQNELAPYHGQHLISRRPSKPPSSLSERLVRLEVTQEFLDRRISLLEQGSKSMSSERLKWAVGWVLILMSAGVLKWPQIAINIAATLGGK